MTPETHVKEYFTTARVIHMPKEKDESTDWLWINTNSSHQFSTAESAQHIANLSNDNGKDSGLDIENYPYFVVRITQSSRIERI